MVGSCDVKFPIRLEGLVLAHGQFSRYSKYVSEHSKLLIILKLLETKHAFSA